MKYCSIFFLISFLLISCQKQKDSQPLPGASAYSSDLTNEIKKREEELRKNFAHTKHLDSDGNTLFTNRLIFESSSYLLQFSHNPVNWYSWSDEAFNKAKELNLPIFVSIGNSFCHWDSIMQEESFEDLELARYLNENFISIKVDSEERSDIDSLFKNMNGWPKNLWLTPDRRPFFNHSYLPDRSGKRGVNRGLFDYLKTISAYYKKNREMISKDLEKAQMDLENMLGAGTEDAGEFSIPKINEVLKGILGHFDELFDSENGGILGAPKFPSSIPFRFFLREHQSSKDLAYREKIKNILSKTLRNMERGGVFDHLGGGFFRYSLDEKWDVPNFEKTIYDNALLASTYIEAYQEFRDEEYKNVAKDILDFILKDFLTEGGGFVSSLKSSSLNSNNEAEEGSFYTWTKEEFRALFSSKEADLLEKYFSISQEGNLNGKNVLRKPLSDEEFFSKNPKIKKNDFYQLLSKAKEILSNERAKRPAPEKDMKIISGQNGLAISALAMAGFVFNESQYTNAAKKAGDFLIENLYDQKNKRLYGVYHNKEKSSAATLEDYATIITSFLDLYEFTSESKWLLIAYRLEYEMEALFEDIGKGGFYREGSDVNKLAVREKPLYDRERPSGNSLQLMNLIKLGRMTSLEVFSKRINSFMNFLGPVFFKTPMSISEALLAISFYSKRAKEIVLISPRREKEKLNPYIDVLRNSFFPQKVIFYDEERGENFEKLKKYFPILQEKVSLKGKVTAYICQDAICEAPITEIEEFKKELMQ